MEFGVEIGSSGPYLRLGFFGVRFRPALDSGSFGLHGYALHCDCCTSWPCMVPVECGAPPRTHTCRFMPHGMRHSVCGAMCGSCVSGSGSCVMRCRWRSGDACRWRYDICRSGYGFMEPLPGGWVHLRARSRGGLPPPKDTCGGCRPPQTSPHSPLATLGRAAALGEGRAPLMPVSLQLAPLVALPPPPVVTHT